MTGRAERAYRQLLERLREIALLQSTMSLLSWDQQTHMPRGSGELRARAGGGRTRPPRLPSAPPIRPGRAEVRVFPVDRLP